MSKTVKEFVEESGFSYSDLLNSVDRDEFISPVEMLEYTGAKNFDVKYGVFGNDFVYHIFSKDGSYPEEEKMREILSESFRESIGTDTDASGLFVEPEEINKSDMPQEIVNNEELIRKVEGLDREISDNFDIISHPFWAVKLVGFGHKEDASEYILDDFFDSLDKKWGS